MGNIPSGNGLLIYDPVPFMGGSKIAVQRLLNTKYNHSSVEQQLDIHVLTLDRQSWQHKPFKLHRLWLPRWLQRQSRGALYYLKQSLLWLQVMLRLWLLKDIRSCMAISGPGVDLAGLIAAKCQRIPSILIIQGPVAASRLSLFALEYCEHIFYLESMKPFIERLIKPWRSDKQNAFFEKTHSFVNGLDKATWPKPHQCQTPKVLWAASLLKWKGLDVFQRALLHPTTPPEISADVCYITPKQATMAASAVPENSHNLRAWHNPKSLDSIRSQCSIFVSTAENEPFGLSILEAMASGLCPIIPEDGAYWDTILKDDVNCIKYPPGDHIQLAEKFASLATNMEKTLEIGSAAREVANTYTAEERYQHIIEALLFSKPQCAGVMAPSKP